MPPNRHLIGSAISASQTHAAAQRTMFQIKVRMIATWRIRLNDQKRRRCGKAVTAIIAQKFNLLSSAGNYGRRYQTSLSLSLFIFHQTCKIAVCWNFQKETTTWMTVSPACFLLASPRHATCPTSPTSSQLQDPDTHRHPYILALKSLLYILWFKNTVPLLCSQIISTRIGQ